jgi:hypothetical protein
MTDHRLQLVTWRDAHAVTETWTHIDELDKHDCVVTSVGILLENVKPGYVVLAQSMIDGEHTVDHVLAIPVGMVVSAVDIAV